jgi:hypothetical protein
MKEKQTVINFKKTALIGLIMIATANVLVACQPQPVSANNPKFIWVLNNNSAFSIQNQSAFNWHQNIDAVNQFLKPMCSNQIQDNFIPVILGNTNEINHENTKPLDLGVTYINPETGATSINIFIDKIQKLSKLGLASCPNSTPTDMDTECDITYDFETATSRTVFHEIFHACFPKATEDESMLAEYQYATEGKMKSKNPNILSITK